MGVWRAVGGHDLLTYHSLSKECERIRESCGGGNSFGFRRGGRETLALSLSYLLPFFVVVAVVVIGNIPIPFPRFKHNCLRLTHIH